MGFYVHEISVGVAKYARMAGWILNDITSRNRLVPCGWKGNGIVTLLPGRARDDLLQFVKGAGVPVVDLSEQMPELPFARVTTDDDAIGRMAAGHFITRGFDHLAFFAQDINAPVVRQRMGGFRAAALAAGRKFHLIDYTPLSNRPKATTKMLPWLAAALSRLPKPLAVMAQYDAEANDIVRACQIADLAVPDEVAVIGVDNDPIYAELGPLPLSSVVTNRELVGYRGAELLDRLMAGEEPPGVTLRIPPDGVVVRRSSDVIAAQDVNVAKALAFIAQRYRSPITVDEIVAASGASRSKLYTKFALHTGHSIQREIVRQRLEHAKLLLRGSQDKLQNIAEACGFEEAAQLSKTFKYCLGISVARFREEHQTDLSR
ncbi:MAG: DNA-binding transcriptional regulator [Undibacterium sp.]|nr:DNA-binding transcriptional regulator [Opitutaceae bacterium]